MFFSHFFFLQPLTNMYKPFKHDRVTALKQCQVLWLLCRSLAPRRYNKQKSWECALQWCSQDPQHLPALPATHLPLAYCPPVCWGFLVILFYLPPDFFILQSSIQFLEPSSLLHALLRIVRRQKLISLRVSTTWTLSTTARVWAGVTLAQGNIPRFLQPTDCGGSIAVWSLAMLIVASQRKSLAISGYNTLWVSSVVQTQTQMYSERWGKSEGDTPLHASGIYHNSMETMQKRKIHKWQ